MTKRELLEQLGPYDDNAPVLLFLDGNTIDIQLQEFHYPDGKLDTSSVQLEAVESMVGKQ